MKNIRRQATQEAGPLLCDPASYVGLVEEGAGDEYPMMRRKTKQLLLVYAIFLPKTLNRSLVSRVAPPGFCAAPMSFGRSHPFIRRSFSRCHPASIRSFFPSSLGERRSIFFFPKDGDLSTSWTCSGDPQGADDPYYDCNIYFNLYSYRHVKQVKIGEAPDPNPCTRTGS